MSVPAIQLKMKTLIIVHNTFLKDQWEDRIKAFLPDVTIGHLQGETVDVDKDIVIAMIQSISMKEYPKEVFRWRGLHILQQGGREYRDRKVSIGKAERGIFRCGMRPGYL